MVKEIQYTNIRRVLDNILDHPLLRDVTLEQAVRHTVRFIQLNGFPKLYQDKIVDVEIHDWRGLLPCDLVSIIQVKDRRSGVCLRGMTDNFTPGMEPKHRFDGHPGHPDGKHKPCDEHKEVMKDGMLDDIYIPPLRELMGELAFKTQGRVIYTSFPEGCVEVAYKSIPVDEDGFPLLVDNENYLAALEAYIKKQVFVVKFDTGKISAGVLQNAKQEYAFLAGQLQAEFTMPSLSEMESVSRMLQTLIPKVREFDSGFKNLGDREYLRRH